MSKPKGMFEKLIDGELDRASSKGWQGGVLLIIPTCTGNLSSSGKAYPLNRPGPINPNSIEPGKTMTHAEFKARNRALALEKFNQLVSGNKLQ